MFRGREVTHPERGQMILERLAEELQELAQVEQRPNLDGRNMTMMLGPSKAVLAGQFDKDHVDDGDAASAASSDSDSDAERSGAPAPDGGEQPQAEAPAEAEQAQVEAPAEAEQPAAEAEQPAAEAEQPAGDAEEPAPADARAAAKSR
jgi:translation initiation factor IF-3